jgi:hypothetical protein
MIVPHFLSRARELKVHLGHIQVRVTPSKAVPAPSRSPARPGQPRADEPVDFLLRLGREGHTGTTSERLVLAFGLTSLLWTRTCTEPAGPAFAPGTGVKTIASGGPEQTPIALPAATHPDGISYLT